MKLLKTTVISMFLGMLSWLCMGRASFINYDTAWSLVWTRETWMKLGWNLDPTRIGFDLNGPEIAADRLFMPTPHPLSDLFSAIISPLSSRVPSSGPAATGAEFVMIATAIFFLGLTALLIFRLTRRWFGLPAAILAAVIWLTREPILSYGLRTYLDLPYTAFLLLALDRESLRPRNGYTTLFWLTLAGMLRPEAWLIAGFYWLYLAFVDRKALANRWRWLIVVALLTLLAPATWVIEGLLMTGEPLMAFTGTQTNAQNLNRETGFFNAFGLLPRRIGEIVREPVLLGAFFSILALLLSKQVKRYALLLATLAACCGAYVLLGAGGLPLLTRYAMMPAALIIILACGLLSPELRSAASSELKGSHRSAPSINRRVRPLMLASFVAALIVLAPMQANRLNKLQSTLSDQKSGLDDLRKVAGLPELRSDEIRLNAMRASASLPDLVTLEQPKKVDCVPNHPALKNSGGLTVGLRNHRTLPQVLLWSGQSQERLGPYRGVNANYSIDVIGDQPERFSYVIWPATKRVSSVLVLDRADNQTQSNAWKVSADQSKIIWGNTRSPQDAPLIKATDSWLIAANYSSKLHTLARDGRYLPKADRPRLKRSCSRSIKKLTAHAAAL